MLPRRDTIGLAGWLLLCLATAAIGGFAAANASGFYLSLSRPPWAPPAWLFGPVWTALYIAMGLAAWLVWKAQGWAGARGVLTLFVAQLGANALWTWLFFAWRLGAAAFVEVLVLWLMVAGTTLGFWRVRRLAALLLVPYLAWVGFAAALTLSVWQRNPQLLGLASLA